MDICPNEFSILLCEVEEGFDNIREVWAKIVDVAPGET